MNQLVQTSQPLAEKMRPQRLDDFFGQTSLVSSGAPLRRAIESDSIQSFLLWGPPGTGKTTLARIVAHHTDREFIALSAVMSGVKDIKEAIARAQYNRDVLNKKTILFIDEIHRFNKSQQDALLPFVEDGTLTLIGATTENPSFELNSALLSRAPVFVLKQLSNEELTSIIKRALNDSTNGFGSLNIQIPESWISIIVDMANGDARKSLTLLERVVAFTQQSKNIDFGSNEFLYKALGEKTLRYDSKGEEHYDTVSAFIKSMRDSDPDAAIYYCARMLEGGEDPLFIVRRMVIFASEDIGNADPRALQVALSVKDAVDFVGMPEARINLAQGVSYLASAPKSNASYVAIDAAIEDVRKFGNLNIPLHIRNAPTKLMKDLGYSNQYKYAHDQHMGHSGMKNLPQELKNKFYYLPKGAGLEIQIKEKLDRIRKDRT